MELLWIIPSALAFTFILVCLIGEFADWQVYGPKLTDNEIGPYLEKYLPTAVLNEFSSDRNLFAGMPQYVARLAMGVSCKWYIEDYGRIPRSSKWTKAIDERRAELIAQEKPRRLADL